MIHGSFSSRSTTYLGDPLLCLMSFHPSCSVRYLDSRCSRILSVVPRRGLQQRYNNISVFILVWHVFMSSLLTKLIVQHHRSRVSPIQLRDFPLAPIATRVSFSIPFVYLEMSLVPSMFVPLPFSHCMGSTSYVFPFRVVFFYLWPRARFLT